MLVAAPHDRGQEDRMCDNARECEAARAQGFRKPAPAVDAFGGPVTPAVRIRPAREADLGRILDIHRAAFDTPTEAALVEALIAGGYATVSLVALADAVVVGHVLLSPGEIVGEGGETWPLLVLAPVAVEPSHQGQGIGSALVTAALHTARKAGARVVSVLGHPEYYPRFGFEEALPYGIHAPFPDVPSEAWMVAELDRRALDGVGGVVRYAPPFDGLV
jgi:putative acetyltransferase